MKQGRPSVIQKHHVIYPNGRNVEVVRHIRKGVHAAITLLRRFNYLTTEEVNTVIIECLLKQKME